MQNSSYQLENYFSVLIDERLIHSSGNLKYYLQSLYNGIDFQDKAILDIGCGNGLYSFYPACMNAKIVTCLEPEIDGGHSGMVDQLTKLHKRLKFDQVRLNKASFQEYDPGDLRYDVILLHNSINHLNETACIQLLTNRKSWQIYQEIFNKLYMLCNDGAKLIICDCSSKNFFAQINIRNPIDPFIEWHKHHPPEIWLQLAVEGGFINPVLHWDSFNSLRSLGKVLFGNRIMSYFLTSHYCLRLEKQ